MRTVVDQIVAKAGGLGTLTLLGDDAGVIEQVPWRQVHLRARRVAGVFAQLGLGPGGRVGLVADTSVDLVVAVQAVWLCGGAVTLMPPAGRGNAAIHRAYLRSVAADARLDLVIADQPLLSSAGAAQPVITLGELARRAEVVAPAAVQLPDPGDLALLQYTSGSTREPRGVPVTHRHLAANVEAIKAVLGHDAPHEARTLSWLPLYHDMGLIAFFAMPMSCGCSLYLQSPASFARRPAGWLEAMSRYRITMSGAPNFAYALMTRLLSSGTRLNLTSIECLISGGEPVDAAMMAKFAECGRRFGLDPKVLMPAYGLAEATLCATATALHAGLQVDWVEPGPLEQQGVAVPCAPGPQAKALVRLGLPVRATSVRITDRRTGQPIADRLVGHVEVRGPAVVGHYWGEPPPQSGTWLRTGDLGYLADGQVVICGREKDILFAAGRNIYPQDVEAVATDVPGVRPGGAVAFAISSASDSGTAVPAGTSERLVIAVEVRAGDAARLRQEVAQAVLNEIGTAADVIAVPFGALPKTSSGKLRRAEARRRYVASEFKVLTPERVAEMEIS